jgi:hypothetical protein
MMILRNKKNINNLTKHFLTKISKYEKYKDHNFMVTHSSS